MNKLLTISIAAYNVQDYIKHTLDSLIVPEIMDYLEVFIIDDGGNDDTLSIAKQYQSMYPKTFFPIHKVNGGYGSTVTWSVNHATGKYFKLLDGDDWFDKNGLIKLINLIRTTDSSDVIISNVAENPENGNENNKYNFLRKSNLKLSASEAAKMPVVAMWAYTFKTSIVKKAYEDLPLHTLYTDQIFVVEVLSESHNFLILPDVVYHWRLGRDEASNNLKSIRKHFREIIKVSDFINDFYVKKRSQMDIGTKKYVIKRVAAYYSNSVSMLLKLEKSKQHLNLIRCWDSKIRKDYTEIYDYSRKSKKLNLLRRTKFVLYWLL